MTMALDTRLPCGHGLNPATFEIQYEDNDGDWHTLDVGEVDILPGQTALDLLVDSLLAEYRHEKYVVRASAAMPSDASRPLVAYGVVQPRNERTPRPWTRSALTH